jgi:hypothetical protein
MEAMDTKVKTGTKKKINEIEDYPNYLIGAAEELSQEVEVHYTDISDLVKKVNEETWKKKYYLTNEFFAGQIIKQEVHGYEFSRFKLGNKTIYAGTPKTNPNKIIMIENVEKYVGKNDLDFWIRKNYSDK